MIQCDEESFKGLDRTLAYLVRCIYPSHYFHNHIYRVIVQDLLVILRNDSRRRNVKVPFSCDVSYNKLKRGSIEGGPVCRSNSGNQRESHCLDRL